MKNLIIIIAISVISNFLNAQEFSFIHDGIERSYRVFVPSIITNRTALPLVLNLHGAGSNALEQQFYSQFDEVADTADIVVVYPNGLGGFWNVYSDTGTDDVGFISALIDTISAEYNIDLQRVYTTGMSMGGIMSYRLACQLNNKFAAMGAVAGTMVYPTCLVERPIPVCHFHGTADSIVPYNLVPITINYWKGNNGCTDSKITNLPDIDTMDQSTVTLTTYRPCNEDVEVRLYTIVGGGHSWPGADHIIDITNRDINASAELWNFFSKFTLPDYSAVPELDLNNKKLKVYPNPIVREAVIEIPGSTFKNRVLQLRDLSGKLIWRKQTGSEIKITFERADIKPGIYLLELLSIDGIMREKIIIN